MTKRADEVILRPKWVNHGPRQRRDAARALLKLGLGVIWLAKGPHETDRSKYDHVRDAIHGDMEVPLHHGFGNTELPSHAIQALVVSHDDLRGMRITLDYFGVQLWAETDGRRDQTTAAFLCEAV